MRANIIKIDVEVSIAFSEKELELLEHMSEYEGVAKYHSGTSTRFTLKEWEEFFSKIRSLTGSAIREIRNDREELFKRSYTTT